MTSWCSVHCLNIEKSFFPQFPPTWEGLFIAACVSPLHINGEAEATSRLLQDRTRLCDVRVGETALILMNKVVTVDYVLVIGSKVRHYWHMSRKNKVQLVAEQSSSTTTHTHKKHMHTCTHTRTHAHAHTRTFTHMPVCAVWCDWVCRGLIKQPECKDRDQE